MTVNEDLVFVVVGALSLGYIFTVANKIKIVIRLFVGALIIIPVFFYAYQIGLGYAYFIGTVFGHLIGHLTVNAAEDQANFFDNLDYMSQKNDKNFVHHPQERASKEEIEEEGSLRYKVMQHIQQEKTEEKIREKQEEYYERARKKQERDNRNSRSNNGGGETGGKTSLSPYEVLGVSKDATKKEIKDTYRRLARTYHNDGRLDLSEATIIHNNIMFDRVKKAYEKIKEQT